MAESTEKIMAAAIELLAERGYEATTTGAIAKRAGFARSMVNSRFGDKAGLLAAMFETHWINELLGLEIEADSGLNALLGIIERLRRFVANEPVRLRAFLVVSFEAAGPSSIPSDQITGPLDTLKTAVERALLRGQADGSVVELQDVSFHAERIIDIALGMVYRWVVDPDGYQLQDRLRRWRQECAEVYGA
ncbi:TetR/AcrR family transcriptional regulator [Nocardia fluminea]|uniref:TetR/AcrR family transcriptional regulator n=1 Tax=Nocardia fluminea TaxID=134984 RepID=UPI0038025B74